MERLRVPDDGVDRAIEALCEAGFVVIRHDDGTLTAETAHGANRTDAQALGGPAP